MAPLRASEPVLVTDTRNACRVDAIVSQGTVTASGSRGSVCCLQCKVCTLRQGVSCVQADAGAHAVAATLEPFTLKLHKWNKKAWCKRRDGLARPGHAALREGKISQVAGRSQSITGSLPSESSAGPDPAA